VKTISSLWKENGEKVGLKVRYLDWGHKHKYFSIEGTDEKKKFLLGTLDNGEKIKYAVNSSPWKVYEINDEKSAQAV